MPRLNRDGVELFYEEAGVGAPPVLLVHGFLGDHTNLQPQIEHLRKTQRVVTVDRRGYGASDAPRQEYTIETAADDLAWLVRELGLYRPVLVQHSMGVIALDVAARYPDMLGGVVLLDAPMFPSADMEEGFRGLAAGLRGPVHQEVVRGFAGATFAPSDDPARREAMIDIMLTRPQHVIVSEWDHFIAFDAAAAAARCRVPLLLISSSFPADVARLASIW